jgi:ATP-binding cassette subfamily B multidrug efflux pump
VSTTYNLAAAPATQGVAWGQIRSLMHPRRALIAGIVVSVLAGAALELAPPLLMQRIVDDHLTPGRAEGLLALALFYLGASGAAQALSFLTTYLTALAAQGALRDLRTALFAHLQKLPMAYFDQTPLGDIISRCTADVDTVDELFSSGVASLLADVLRLVSVAGAMIVLSPLLSLVSVLAAPFLWWITDFFRRRVRTAERANRQAVGRLNTHLHETLGGVEVIRAFGREATFTQRFRLALADNLAAYNQATVYSALYTPLMAILSAVVAALLLWVGALNTLSRQAGMNVSLGTLIAFVLLFRRFFTPIINLGDEWQTVQSAMAGVERIFQVLVLPVEEKPARGEFRLSTNGAAAVELRHVTFGYFPEQPILRQISLSVRAGEHVALVGRTGAGKTSTMHLLAGMYKPWSGTVRAAGLDPRQLLDADRRRVVGVVPQTVQLFSGTVLDNLTLGDGAVKRADVERAATITGAAGFILALPQGYDTLLGNASGTGAQLSSGQRQLLALTRALVWNPPVLMLDEATALVDSATEAAFRAALRSDPTRAVFIIAHRLSTAREADRVIVMGAGRIVEAGTPDDLIQRGGRFAALLALEAAGWDWRVGPDKGRGHDQANIERRSKRKWMRAN